MIKIIKLIDILNKSERDSVIEQVKYIFYVSSSIKEFSSEERKVSFFKRWCGDYIELFPQHFLIMIENEKVLGYLSGCVDSTQAIVKLSVPGYQLYEDLFQKYPAHFHINFHPDCRGRGLGSQIVDFFCQGLTNTKVHGVHLVTSPDAANVSFYEKLNFNDKVIRPFNQNNLLFMGRLLDDTTRKL